MMSRHTVRDSGRQGLASKPVTGLNRRWLVKNRWLLVFLGAYVLFSILLFDPKLSVGGDNAVYLILAGSLARGTGYRSVYLPEQPEHTQYPPGFPATLAVLEKISGRMNIFLDKVLVVVSGVLAMFIVYRLCGLWFAMTAAAAGAGKNSRAWSSDGNRLLQPGWLAMALIVSIPMLIKYNHYILTEIPFLSVSMAAVYFLLRAEDMGGVNYWAGFACAIAGFLLRTAGIALVLGVILLLAFRKQYWYLAVFVVVFLAVFVPWEIRAIRAGTGQSYFEQFFAKNPYIPDFGRAGVKDFVVRIGENAVKYFAAVIPQQLCAVLQPGWFSVGVGVVLSGLMVLGFAVVVRVWTIVETYFVFAFAVLFGWPSLWAGERFFLPVAPLAVMYIVAGLCWLEHRLRRKYLAAAVVGVLVVVNMVALALAARKSVGDNIRYLAGDRYAGYSLDWRRYFECIEWIRDNVPEDRVILARKPEFVYLLSGCRSFCPPFTGDQAAVKAAIEKCDYILFDNFYWTNLFRVFVAPVLKQDMDRFRYVFKTEKPVFFVLRASGRPGGPGAEPVPHAVPELE